MIKLSATFLLQAASKIMPYMPKFDKDLSRSHLLSQLHDLAWWHDELAEMARIVYNKILCPPGAPDSSRFLQKVNRFE